MIFAAATGMRPGELYALEWPDIDLKRNRVHVQRRLYKGTLDLPKSGKARVIALPPPARDALMELGAWHAGSKPMRKPGLVFKSKTGKRLSQATLSGYWSQVKAAAGPECDFDFYLATKPTASTCSTRRA